MTYAPRITDESVLTRWIGIEIAKMNGAIVSDRRCLSGLLDEEVPAAVSRNGEPYVFDRNALLGFAAGLPAGLRRQLRLPILFYATPDVPYNCSCPDAAALAALQQHGEVSTLRTLQGTRFWVSRPIVHAIMRKFPTLFQMVTGA